MAAMRRFLKKYMPFFLRRNILLIGLVSFQFLSSIVTAYSQDLKSPLDKYRDAIHNRSPREIAAVAKETLRATDDKVIYESLQDLLRYSKTTTENQSALEVVTSLIAGKSADSSSFRHAKLARGKLLRRLGRKEESEALFQEAIPQQWDEAMWRYSESMIDSGDLDQASIMEYRRIIGKEPYSYYRGAKEDFFIFNTLLRLMKSSQPSIEATQRVFSVIDDSTAYPTAKSIAQVLCLSEDGRHEEALQVLEQVDQTLNRSQSPAGDKESPPILDEYRNLPLFKCYILLRQGIHLDQASQSFQEFMARSRDNPKYLFSRAIRIVLDLEIDQANDLRKAQVITSQLLNSELIKNSEIQSTFSDYEISQLYDLHQMSLSWDGRFDESEAACRYVVGKYYPGTLAGANCKMCLALFESWRDHDLDRLELTLNNILQDTSFPEIIPWVKLNLAQIAFKHQDAIKAQSYVDDILQIIGPDDKGSVVQCRIDALALLKEIQSIGE